MNVINVILGLIGAIPSIIKIINDILALVHGLPLAERKQAIKQMAAAYKELRLTGDKMPMDAIHDKLVEPVVAMDPTRDLMNEMSMLLGRLARFQPDIFIPFWVPKLTTALKAFRLNGTSKKEIVALGTVLAFKLDVLNGPLDPSRVLPAEKQWMDNKSE